MIKKGMITDMQLSIAVRETRNREFENEFRYSALRTRI